MTKILVTGAAGFIGRHTVEYLVKYGDHRVLAVDIKDYPRDMHQLEKESNWKLGLFYADLTKDDISSFIDEGDKILHLAAQAHFVTTEDLSSAVAANVLGTAKLIQSCVKKKAERLVYASTGSVYSTSVGVPIRESDNTGPTPDNIYGWTKKQAEEWVRNYWDQLPYVILRYSYIYGLHKDWGAIGHWLYHDIPNEKQPKIFGGNQTNDFLYIKDLVKANYEALYTEITNEIYNIGSGKETSIQETCDLCLKAMDSSLEPSITPARSFDYQRFVYSIDLARKNLDFKPKWYVGGGIPDMVREMKEYEK